MKKKFSSKWKGSRKARKQRKYRFNAPLHIKQRLMSVNLSKELRKKYGRRNIESRKDDVVRILSGKFRNKKGKIIDIDPRRLKVTVEGIQITKKDGTKVPIWFYPSRLQIVEISSDDKKRFANKNQAQDKRSADKNQVQDKKPADKK